MEVLSLRYDARDRPGITLCRLVARYYGYNMLLGSS
jgi:hypothetical protein